MSNIVYMNFLNDILNKLMNKLKWLHI